VSYTTGLRVLSGGDDVPQLDAWIAAQPEPRPSRPEAIRLALKDWLTGLGYLPARDDPDGGVETKARIERTVRTAAATGMEQSVCISRLRLAFRLCEPRTSRYVDVGCGVARCVRLRQEDDVLYDEDRIAPDDGSMAHDLQTGDVLFEVKAPNSIRQGVTDVVSMRAIARAFATLVSPPSDTFDRALTRTLNLNSSLAASLTDEHG